MAKSFLAKRLIWLGTEWLGQGAGRGAGRLHGTAFRLD